MTIVNRLSNAIYNQFPFIVIFMILMGTINTLQWIHGRIVSYEEGVSVLRLTGNVSIWFLMAFIQAVIIDSSQKSWVKCFFYLVSFSMFAIDNFLMQNFETHISSTIITLVLETNGQESKEFLQSFLCSSGSIKTYTNLSLLIALAFFLERLWSYSKVKLVKVHFRFRRHALTFLGVACLVFSVWGLYSSNIYLDIWNGRYTGRMDKPNDPFSLTYSALLELRNDKQNVNQLIDVIKGMSSPAIYDGKDSLNIVLVIGESHIKHHSSIYGYPLKTTPIAEQESKKGKLIIFTDVVTPANNTTIVLKNLLSCNNVSKGEQWFDHPLFTSIFKKAGYNVMFWDNQLTLDVGTQGFFQVRNFLYNPIIKDLSFSINNEKGFEFDNQLIDDFSSNIQSLKARNLIVFHLKGQHIDAAQRFPHNAINDHFKIDSINRNDSYLTKQRKQRIADYDNAILYMDKVLEQIYHLFQNSNSIIIYLSDHGDEVYDWRNQFGREFGAFTPQKLHCQFDVPFWVWFSDKYMTCHKDIVDKFQKARNRPFMTDKTCHMLFNIGNVNTRYYDEEADILSANYVSGKRIVNFSHDYDEIINPISH